ncbi:malate dehydrogenase, putative [Perkinsus marinus ATCC 50983]|uniref:Malate dehydrogenase n=1 Tax=Perkinsus marinus (strain ATCC 50983 / TXsc) TaxID=423536 RepID=C5KJN8_PERM5|nr:malate dehydrogenase, putative [Perkinsus marinus ATCC 50983]EER15372.1 malate dehydrogenase, putative [Perkinsus marinus ATCC 50983]|eukprot:XP_002783576.1 malate dehydrogenase, putative [Perkinsus marinus ATCC 50983]
MSSTTTCKNTMKVTLIGASGAIGMSLSLLLKLNPLITELALYDVHQARIPVPGIAADNSHINTPAKVRGYVDAEHLPEAVTGSNVIIVCAGIAQKPGMSREDLFGVDAGIMRDIATTCAKYAPNAMMCIMSNPETSLVPLTAEIYKKAGVYDRKKLLGITTLDVTRARTFYAEATGLDVEKVHVPVVGGHGGCAILALFSHATPFVKLDENTIKALDEHVQTAVTEVVDALAGAGSASLSMAYSAAEFIDTVIRGLQQQGGGDYQQQKKATPSACAYVNWPYQGCEFFAQVTNFGPEGIEGVQPIDNLSPFEEKRMVETVNKVKGDVEKGMAYVEAHQN